MKERLDVLLVNRNLAESREKAKAILMSGIVYVDGQKEDKAGTMFEEEKIKIGVDFNTLSDNALSNSNKTRLNKNNKNIDINKHKNNINSNNSDEEFIDF